MSPKRKSKAKHETSLSKQPKPYQHETVEHREVQDTTRDSSHGNIYSEQIGQPSLEAAIPGSSSDGTTVKMSPKKKSKAKHKTSPSKQPKPYQHETVEDREVQDTTRDSSHGNIYSEQIGQPSLEAAIPGSSSDGTTGQTSFEAAIPGLSSDRTTAKHKTSPSKQPKPYQHETVEDREVQDTTRDSSHGNIYSEQIGQTSLEAAIPCSSSDETTETVNRLCKEMINASIGYIRTIDQSNEDDQDKRRPEFAGLGTVVFGQYLITAYHVLRERIRNIYDEIIFSLTHQSTKQDEIQQLILETYVDMHALTFSELVGKFIDRRRNEESNNVDRILKQICKFVNTGDLNSRLSSEMNVDKCVVEFSCGKFLIDWKILYGDETNDLAIVQLKTTRQQSFPNTMSLDDQGTSPQKLKMEVVREFKTNIPKLVLELQPLTRDELEEMRRDLQWNDSPIFDQHLVIFRTKEWFKSGTSGSSMIYVKQNQVIIHAIFQKMHPEQHFIEHGYDRYIKDWQKLLGSGRKTFNLTEIFRNNELLPAAPAPTIGSSPLCTACRDGNTEFVTMLLDDGAGVNVCDRKGCTPLENAIAGNHFDVVVMLIGKIADVDKCGTAVSASTPLCTACRDGRLDIVRVLLHAGADISIPNGNGRSPLQLARDGNHEEIIRFLESYS